jgi:hypothetical protein
MIRLAKPRGRLGPIRTHDPNTTLIFQNVAQPCQIPAPAKSVYGIDDDQVSIDQTSADVPNHLLKRGVIPQIPPGLPHVAIRRDIFPKGLLAGHHIIGCRELLAKHTPTTVRSVRSSIPGQSFARDTIGISSFHKLLTVFRWSSLHSITGLKSG